MKSRSLPLGAAAQLFTFLAVTTIAAAAAHAATLTVSNTPGLCPNAQYASIQMAIDASKPGDLINVCPGTYNEVLSIDQYHSNLTVQGITVGTQNQVVISPPFSELPPAVIVDVISTKDITLRNLTIDGSAIFTCSGLNLIGVRYGNASGTMEGLTIRNLNAPCVPRAIDVGGVPNHVDILNCNIHDFSNNGIVVDGSDVNVTIKGNVISGPGVADVQQYGILIQHGAKAVIDGNVITYGTCIGANNCSAQNPDSADIAIDNPEGGKVPRDGAKITNNILGRNKYNLRLSGSNCDVHDNVMLDSYSAFAVLITGNLNNLSNNSISHSANTAIRIDGYNNTVHKNVINEAQIGIQNFGSNNNLGSRLREIRGIPVEVTANTFYNVQTTVVQPGP